MKKKFTHFQKIHKSTAIKAVVVIALIVVIEIVAGIFLYRHFASQAYDVKFAETDKKIASVSERLDGNLILTGDETTDADNILSRLDGWDDVTFDYFVVFVNTTQGRIVGASEGCALSGTLSAYDIDFQSVATYEIMDGTYVFAASRLGDSSYYVAGLADFSSQQSAIDKMMNNFIVLYVIESVLILCAFVFYVYWAGGRVRKGRFEYKFTCDENNKVLACNKKFRDDFGRSPVIKGNLSGFDKNAYNALKLRGLSGEKLLVTRVGIAKNGTKVKVSASAIKNIGSFTELYDDSEDLTANGKAKVSLSTAFEEFVKRGKRTLIGVMFISNLAQISALFGKDMALDIQRDVLKKAQEKFSYVYELDFAYIGMAYPDGKELDFILSDMERILRFISQPIKIDDNLFTVELKSGFALCDASFENLTFDYAMKAVEAARSRVLETKIADYIIYHESQKKLYAKYFITYDIKQMLSEGAFEMEYQPQYNIKQGRIAGFEALFRVKKSWNVNVDTFSFITYAERTGAMVQLGEFIFDTGMNFAKKLEGKNVSVSLNVSPVQLMQAGFTENFLRLYKKYDLKPGSICVEITESFLMANFQETLKKLEILKSNGITVHLDDFGTEYSSLLYIKKLPISTIKIDKEFVRDVVKSKESQAIISFITSIAGLLDLSTICEGVETIEEFNILNRLGCDNIQGWLIGKSMKTEDALKIVDEFDFAKATRT